MKSRTATWLFVFLITFGCGKDKFTTIPQVNAKSISPETVFQGDIIRFISKFTDKEGDLDSILIVYKWYNGANVTYVDTFRETVTAHNLPQKTTDGEIIIQYSYNRNQQGFTTLTPGASIRDTTATLGLILIDKDSNRSNYTESDRIRLKKL
jgi:hypothetical protein